VIVQWLRIIKKSERKEEKDEHHQDVEELASWYKKIEMIDIDI
jgi:hypothetical protein